MGRSYILTWEGHYKEDGDGENKYHLVYGMSISDIIKQMIMLYNGKVKQYVITIWHQVAPISHRVRKLRINQDFNYPEYGEPHSIHDTFRQIGLDYNKPIPRKFYTLTKLEGTI